jgi:lactate permease
VPNLADAGVELKSFEVESLELERRPYRERMRREKAVDSPVPWFHNYSAVGHSLGLTAMVAALPIFFLFWALAYKRMKGYLAASLTLLLALVVAVSAYGMPVRAAASAAALGMVNGLWPIGWIILTAVFFYNLTVEGGQSAIIQSSISTLSRDRRLQALLIAFCFSAFLEGVAGEGAPVAVAAAMLIGLGFRPLLAAVVCLVANTPPVPFGPVGVPTSMMISVTNINGVAITKTIGSDVAILALVIPLLVLVVISGVKRTIEVWPAALVAGFSYAVTCFLVSHYLGVELPAIISAFVSMVCLIAFLKFWRPKQIWLFSYDSDDAAHAKASYTRRQILTAWSPYLLLMTMMSFWGAPGFTRFIQDKLLWVVNIPHWPGLDGIVYRSAPIVEVPTMYPASYRWNFLTAPGTAMLICAVATMAILRISPLRGLKVFTATCKEVKFALVTLAAVVGVGYLANYSGISYTLGLACASYAGKLFPIFSPAIGWLGVFLTGSVTSSAALFGKLQQVTATQTGLNPVLTTSANIFGGVAGKLISPQSIAIACAATGLVGRETDIFRKTIKYSLTLLGLVVLIVLIQAWVVPGVIPVDPATGMKHLAFLR